VHYFITGGAGFIGSNFVDLLLSNSDSHVDSITVFDKLTYSGNLKNLKDCMANPKLTFIKGDICDYETLVNAMRGKDIVVHFAAESHVDNSILNADKFIQTNVSGTQRVLEAALNTDVARVVNVSTDEVYGSVSTGSSSENAQLAPNSPYSSSKAGADLIARAYFKTYGLNVVTTRSANNFGKYQHLEKLIPLMVDRLSHGLRIPIYGTGLNVREWIHVTDNCRAILKVAQLGVAGDIYNIGSGNELTNLEVARTVLEIMQVEEDRIEFVNDRKGHDFRYKLDDSKLSSLGHVNSIDWREGLRSYVSWHLSSPDHWTKD
jgi:dTDP-glucose 4,6-dehydratase